MADPRWRVKWRHLTLRHHSHWIWYHFVEQAQGYPINVSLARCALTEQKPEGVPSIYPLYDGGLTNNAKDLNSIRKI